MFYLNSTINFGIPTVLVFQLQVYYNVDRLLTGLTAPPKGTTARWYSNKTSLPENSITLSDGRMSKPRLVSAFQIWLKMLRRFFMKKNTQMKKSSRFLVLIEIICNNKFLPQTPKM